MFRLPTPAALCFALPLAVSLTTACASVSVGSQQAYLEGWRSARVEHVVASQERQAEGQSEGRKQGAGTVSCSADATHAGSRKAVASYSFGGSPTLRARQLVVVPDDMNLQAGDKVLINVRDCAAPARQVPKSVDDQPL